MRAVCWRHPGCSFTRQCKESVRLGRPGRPIGLCWSFLAYATHYKTKLQHQNAMCDWDTLAARGTARTDFEKHPKAAAYLVEEAGGPGLGEPRISDM